MYAAPYVHPDGFASVGFLEDVNGKLVSLADPIFGSLSVRSDNVFGVIHTETGAMLPAVAPILVESPVSEHLSGSERLVANDADVLMLKPRHKPEAELFPSGYPHAWEIIRRWREGVATDWRTLALAAIFARTTIQRPIEEAEQLFRTFGPTIRDALVRGQKPSEEALMRFRGIKGTRAVIKRRAGKRRGEFAWDDIPAYVEIFEWAPWASEQANTSSDFTRNFRDRIASEWAPRGIGLAKVSFTMMLIGRDAACLDTRMQRFFFGEYEEEETMFSFGELEGEEVPESPERGRFMKRTMKRSQKPEARGFLPSAIKHYRDIEDRLSDTPYFDPEWPMPYAKAQWMLWETLGRTAGTADHGALWEVIGPLISDIDRGKL